MIQAEIIKKLEEADLVLCDCSTLNANVFFELGIRTSLDRPVCLVRDDVTPQLPFDTSILNTHTYRSALAAWQLQQDIADLVEHIRESAERSDGKNSMWKHFGLTQRGHPAADAVEADPVGAQLELMNAQLEALRRRLETPPSRSSKPSRSRDGMHGTSSMMR